LTHQISVSIVEPGYVKTPLAAKQMGDNALWRQVDPVKRQ
jgi:NAD(P)-dependent dehydrogenase (short-subunit alcohol dehydrogenase family)